MNNYCILSTNSHKNLALKISTETKHANAKLILNKIFKLNWLLVIKDFITRSKKKYLKYKIAFIESFEFSLKKF